MSSLSFDYRITDIKEPYEIDLSFGYNYLKISATYRDGLHLIFKKEPIIPPVFEPIRFQIYNLVYDGIEIGIKGKSNLIPYGTSGTNGLSLEGFLGYTPLVWAEYKGTRWPDTDPAREHIIADGSALGYKIHLSYKLANWFYTTIGYRYNAYRTKGKDQPDSNWRWRGCREELDATFKGFLLGTSFLF
jgi:hypothetical protein